MKNLSSLNYTIADDFDFILEAEKKTIDNLTKSIGISRSTYYEIKKNNYTINSVYEKFYNYVYSIGYRINSVKEDLLKEMEKEYIILFHGSRFGINNISISGSRKNCDFGNGFYLGENYNNTLSFVCEADASSIYSFKINIKNLNIVKFDCSLEWMLTICYFRGTIKEFENSEIIKEIVKKIENADIIIAPIADNRMFYIMTLFANGDINADVALHSLSASKLGLQYVIKTEKALEKLIPIEKYYLCRNEKTEFQNILKNRSNEIETKIKFAKREFKNGLFIEEILK